MRHPTHGTPPARTLVFAMAALLLSALTPPACAAPEAAAGGHDIGALMAAAEERYDLSRLDAVLLLEQLSVSVTSGERSTTVHRIVWFSTELGLDTYADLRVPYNTETSTLTVGTLRTWMDGRWWPHESDISPTAVVATTPGALQSADDYTMMREMMLLHDGVELPCIVETVYTITERVPSGHGSDGLWLIPRADPAVLTILSVEVPSGEAVHHAELNGAPEPEMTPGVDADSYVWSAELTDRLARPLVADAATYAPCVVWSTWSDWDALGEVILGSMREAMVLNQALRDTIARLVAAKPFPLARAQAVVKFVDETTRPVRYDDSFWRFSPRAAERTWATAYGHALDRAVLAAALFEEAGCQVTAFYAGATLDGAGDVPALSRFDGLMLRTEEPIAYYDPLGGELRLGGMREAGRTVWVPGRGNTPQVTGTGASRYELVLSLDANDDGGWDGFGLLATRGTRSSYADVAGIAGETADFLGRVARTTLAGTEVDDCSVAALENGGIVAGFALTLAAPDPDDSGRVRIEMGDPAGGIMDGLPPDVHLYSENRDSPVRLPGTLEQTVTLVLEVGEREVVRLPEERFVENAAGSFRLAVERGTDRVTVTRTLALSPPSISDRAARPVLVRPDAWPDLRALLLEETDHRNRVLLLE